MHSSKVNIKATCMLIFVISQTYPFKNNKKNITYYTKACQKLGTIQKMFFFTHLIESYRALLAPLITFCTYCTSIYHITFQHFKDTKTRFLRNTLAFPSANCFSELSPHIKQSSEHSFAKHI